MMIKRTRMMVSLLAVMAACIVTAGVSILLSVHFENAARLSQQRAGQTIERKLCDDIGTMAHIRPPRGSARRNPSRAYEQAEHQAWTGLYEAIGCQVAPP